VTGETRTPIAPAVVTGMFAAAILLVNVNAPRIIETLCSVALVWANLAYLMVTLPLLRSRLKARGSRSGADASADGRFSLGRWALPVNIAAVCWGVFVVVNMSWPRASIYGGDPVGRFAAILATAGLLAAGSAYYLMVGRSRLGVLPEHAAETPEAADLDDSRPSSGVIVPPVPGEPSLTPNP
jgi:hypothetical protein